jgi:hypothetical protein
VARTPESQARIGDATIGVEPLGQRRPPGGITDRMELVRRGARTFWGLLARTAATNAAHTLLLVLLVDPGHP